MKVSEVIGYLESRAPLHLQQSYDNSGLLVGSVDAEVTGILVCLDSTEAVIAEAHRLGCNLVVAHHPILFTGLKRLTGETYVQRTIMDAIRHDIAIYAIHTNLDALSDGVNAEIASRLELQNLRVLSPVVNRLVKLAVFVPENDAEAVRHVMFEAGAGAIGNYDQCSFTFPGKGTFQPNELANPAIGSKNERSTVDEVCIEVILPGWKTGNVMAAVRRAHPYEEVAHFIYPVENSWADAGSGAIGDLPDAMATDAFLSHLKKTMNCQVIRYTRPATSQVRRIAVCGGSGSFLLREAMKAGADVLVTSDFKYHEFFDAESRIMIADIGHYESEQFTIDLLYAWLSEKFPTFATHKTGVVTNPINYL